MASKAVLLAIAAVSAFLIYHYVIVHRLLESFDTHVQGSDQFPVFARRMGAKQGKIPDVLAGGAAACPSCPACPAQAECTCPKLAAPAACPPCAAAAGGAVGAVGAGGGETLGRPLAPVVKTAQEEKCENNFGYGLVRTWAAAARTTCEPLEGVSDATTFTCRTITQANHGGPDTFCDVKNLYMDFDKIHGPPGGEPIESVKGRAENLEFLKLDKGALGGKCTIVGDRMSASNFQYCTKDIMKSFDTVAPTRRCDTVVEEPTLFVTRYEYANFYHTLSDFFNAYLAHQILGTDPRNARVFIFDAHPWGAFDEAWAKVFAPRHGVQRHGDYEGTVCFRHAIWGIAGYQSPICTQWGEPNNCGRSDLMRDFGRTFLSAYNLLDVPAPSQPSVTFVFREDYIAHPREKDGKRRNKLTNERELLQVAKDGTSVNAQGINYAYKSFREQLEITRKTNILVGMHGAGMSHQVFLPDEAVVIELFPKHVTSKKHFRNLARWAGNTYFAFQNKLAENEPNQFETKMPVDGFTDVLDAAVRVARNFGDNNGYCGLKC